MSRPRLLVVTSVHQPDDPRIRAKLIPTLAAEWDITYATAAPGPSDSRGLEWVRLEGGRLRRTVGASRLLLGRRWDLVAVHDPELLPAAIVRALLGRPSLFDLHENLPEMILTRSWIPSSTRPLLAAAARVVLAVAERAVTITLAEEGYRYLFARPHPVLANHLPDRLPAPVAAAEPPFLVYLGDVTPLRGALLAIEAAAGAGARLVVIGRVAPPAFAEEIRRRADELDVEVELVGPLPHDQALARAAPALAGLSPLLEVGNYRHSLPTKVPEYLALGLPVLASDLEGTRRPVTGLDAVVFVPPGDGDAWRRAGAELRRQPDLRERARLQIPEVRRRFAWQHDAVLAAYREAAR